MRPVVNIRFTNGAGNNIFQYIYARLVAEAKGADLSHPALPVLGIKAEVFPFPKEYETVSVVGSSKIPFDYHSLLKPGKKPVNYDLRIYPEDFTLYTPIINQIKGRFPSGLGTHSVDLVFHLRLGDRLIMSSTYKEENYLTFKDYQEAIDSFEFRHLHIVTDMPVWREITEADLKAFTFHRKIKPADRIEFDRAVELFNSLYTGLNSYKPTVRVGNSIQSDFNYIRSFNKILFQHGTLAWWAAALSNAEEVAVYGRWRGGKGINLGWTDLPGWRQWGRATAPQHDLKDWHLKDIARYKGIRAFVETGTRGGAALMALKDQFDQMYSVEIIEPAFKKVQRKLAKYKHIKLYLGDSAKVLPQILKQLKEPTLFWLDAHDGRKHTPIMDELEIILSHPVCNRHVLVIDDSRYFGTEKAYPTKSQVSELVNKLQPTATIDYKFDAIRIWL